MFSITNNNEAKEIEQGKQTRRVRMVTFAEEVTYHQVVHYDEESSSECEFLTAWFEELDTENNKHVEEESEESEQSDLTCYIWESDLVDSQESEDKGIIEETIAIDVKQSYTKEECNMIEDLLPESMSQNIKHSSYQLEANNSNVHLQESKANDTCLIKTGDKHSEAIVLVKEISNDQNSIVYEEGNNIDPVQNPQELVNELSSSDEQFSAESVEIVNETCNPVPEKVISESTAIDHQRTEPDTCNAEEEKVSVESVCIASNDVIEESVSPANMCCLDQIEIHSDKESHQEATGDVVSCAQETTVFEPVSPLVDIKEMNIKKTQNLPERNEMESEPKNMLEDSLHTKQDVSACDSSVIQERTFSFNSVLSFWQNLNKCTC